MTPLEVMDLIDGALARREQEMERDASRVVNDAALRGVRVSMVQILGPKWLERKLLQDEAAEKEVRP